MAPDKRELLVRAVEGDQKALAHLLDAYTPLLRKALAGQISPRWQSLLTAEDVIQETYIDAFLDIGRSPLGDDGSLPKWLLKIAKRNLLDALRMLRAEKRGGNRRRNPIGGRDESYMALCEVLERSSVGPSRVMAKKEARAALERALQLLPEQYRRVVLMYDLEGRTSREVGAVLGRSPGAVFMLRARAHRRLADLLGSESRFLSK